MEKNDQNPYLKAWERFICMQLWNLPETIYEQSNWKFHFSKGSSLRQFLYVKNCWCVWPTVHLLLNTDLADNQVLLKSEDKMKLILLSSTRCFYQPLRQIKWKKYSDIPDHRSCFLFASFPYSQTKIKQEQKKNTVQKIYHHLLPKSVRNFPERVRHVK